MLPEVHICPAGKLRYLGNGIVHGPVPRPGGPGAALRTVPMVLMVSRLVREKGCADFLGLAARLAGQADFVHVGPFEHDQSDALTEEEVAEATATGTVRFIGGVDDVRPYLASADLVVLPSYREGIPRAAMEAAAMGRPVAAYDIRGVREVIDPALGPAGPAWRPRRADRGGRGAWWVTPTGATSSGRAAGSGSPSGSPRTWSSSGCEPVYAGHGRGRERGSDEGGGMTTEVCLTVDVEDWYDGMAVLGEPIPTPAGARSGLTGLADLLAEPRARPG